MDLGVCNMIALSGMSEKPHDTFYERQSLRCHPRTRRALKRLVGRLSDDCLQYRGADATQEAIVNAIWLALEAMTDDEAGLAKAARWLEPYMAEVEELPRRTEEAEESPPVRATRGEPHGRPAQGDRRNGTGTRNKGA